MALFSCVLLSAAVPGAVFAQSAEPAPLSSASVAGDSAEATGTIEGRVLNVANGRFLQRARVSLAGTDAFVFTNEYGHFRFSDVPSGNVTLEVFYTGMETRRMTVDVVGGESVSARVRMAPRQARDPDGDGDVVELDDFVVTGRDVSAAALALNEQRFSPNVKNVVSTDAFGEVAQGNIGEFLKHIPGVTIEYDGNVAQGVQIRGFASNFTNVTIDGGQVASAATNSTQNHSRTFGLDQTSINNISRIEVTKLPTPANPANSLGGSVNLVTKSAFEREDARLDYSVYLSMNSEMTDFDKTPGPAENRSYKILPSFNLTYTLPVNDQFGVVLTGASVNEATLAAENVAVKNWGDDDTGADTHTIEFRTRQNLATTHRNSIGAKFDYSPWTNHIFSAAYYGNDYSAFSSSRRVRFRHGSIADFGEGYVHGDNFGGYVNNEGTFQDRESENHTFNFRYTYYGKDWEVEAAANRSSSENSYRDTDKGFFRTTDARLSNLRLNFDDIDYSTLTVRDLSAANEADGSVDITTMDDYLLRTVSSSPQDSKDVIEEGRARVRRSFSNIAFRPAIELGASVNDFTRDLDTYTEQWTFVGADGVANTADDRLGAYVDPTFSGQSPGFGYPGFEYASPWLLHDLYVSNPEYFEQSDRQIYDRIRSRALRSATLNEKITAYYAMLEGWFFDNRVRLVGGARYEKTEDKGMGNAQSGDYSHLPNNEEKANLEYSVRGASFGRSYDGIYPSGHATITITDRLQLRAAYAKTIGRPALHHIVPYQWVGENIWDPSESGVPGWVVTSNPGLEPWEADNFDLTLEYYLDNAGLLSVGVFRKDIENFFGTDSTIVDQALIEELGLPQETLGYTYETDINVGDARVQGIEFSYQQPLDFLGPWGERFTVILNYTKLELEGSNEGDFSDFIPKTGNAAIKYSHGRWLAFAKWNYRGKQRREFVDEPVDGAEYIRSRLELDLNVEYQITDYLSIFVSGRNVTNEDYQWERYNDLVPAYERLTSHAKYGAQYTFGVKGSF